MPTFQLPGRRDRKYLTLSFHSGSCGPGFCQGSYSGESLTNREVIQVLGRHPPTKNKKREREEKGRGGGREGKREEREQEGKKNVGREEGEREEKTPPIVLPTLLPNLSGKLTCCRRE